MDWLRIGFLVISAVMVLRGVVQFVGWLRKRRQQGT